MGVGTFAYRLLPRVANGGIILRMAWYKEWFGQEYLELYAHRNEAEAEAHVDFVERLLLPTSGGVERRPKAVLDLACGAGRHTAALRRRGLRTLGVDLSLTLLTQDPSLPRVAADMCCLPFADRSFDWVLNFFTSFGYFETERENLRVLEEVARVLRPEGRFLIDLFNAQQVIRNLRRRETTEMAGRKVEIERWFDADKKRINKRIRVLTPSGQSRSYLESVRAYDRQEVVDGLLRVGLRVDALHGGFEGEPYTSDSSRLIITATRTR